MLLARRRRRRGDGALMQLAFFLSHFFSFFKDRFCDRQRSRDIIIVDGRDRGRARETRGEEIKTQAATHDRHVHGRCL